MEPWSGSGEPAAEAASQTLAQALVYALRKPRNEVLYDAALMFQPLEPAALLQMLQAEGLRPSDAQLRAVAEELGLSLVHKWRR